MLALCHFWNVATRCDSSFPTTYSPDKRSTYVAKCSLEKCAYFLTISTLSQPLNSCNTCKGVPACTCKLAQVCRKSCQRKFSTLAVFKPLYQALVLTG